MNHAALVRGDDGGLAVRRFTRAEDARAHDMAREIVPEKTQDARRKAKWTPAMVGKLIGVSGVTISRRCVANMLPYVDYGTPNQQRFRLTDDTVRLIKIHGLAGVARLRQAGQI